MTKAPTRQLLESFDALHREKFGRPAVIMPGKDGKLLATLFTSHAEYIKPCMDAFFAERGGFQDKAGYTVGVFVSQFARLLKGVPQRPTGGYGAWRDECAVIHNSRCTNVHFHEAMKAR